MPYLKSLENTIITGANTAYQTFAQDIIIPAHRISPGDELAILALYRLDLPADVANQSIAVKTNFNGVNAFTSFDPVPLAANSPALFMHNVSISIGNDLFPYVIQTIADTLSSLVTGKGQWQDAAVGSNGTVASNSLTNAVNNAIPQLDLGGTTLLGGAVRLPIVVPANPQTISLLAHFSQVQAAATCTLIQYHVEWKRFNTFDN